MDNNNSIIHNNNGSNNSSNGKTPPKLHFFSDYSRHLECPHCGANEPHFVKPPQSYQLVRKN